jgi:hypothetical protein
MKIREKELGRPLAVAAAIAVISMAAFFIVEFGPWNREAPDREATRAAAQAAGAKVIPTQPKLAIEPTPPGPQRVQPAAPVVVN